MKTITAIHFAHLRNAEVSGLMADLEASLLSALMADEASVLDEFRNARQVYIHALGNTVEAFQKRLEQADNRVDTAWRALHTISEANSHHPNEAIQKASAIILAAMDQYPNPVHLSYLEEYGILASLLPVLDDIPETTWETAGISLWHRELNASYDAFTALKNDKACARAAIELGAIKTSRENVIARWKELTSLLPSLAMLNPSGSLDNAIDRVNEIIKTKKTTLKTRKQANGEEVSPQNPIA